MYLAFVNAHKQGSLRTTSVLPKNRIVYCLQIAKLYNRIFNTPQASVQSDFQVSQHMVRARTLNWFKLARELSN